MANKVIDLRKKSAAPVVQQPDPEPTIPTPRKSPTIIPPPPPKPAAIPVVAPVVLEAPQSTSPKTEPAKAGSIPSISWDTYSSYHSSDKTWTYVLAAILMGGAIAMVVFQYNLLTSIAAALASIVLVMYSNQAPTMTKIKVDQLGVHVGAVIYPYTELRSFWIDYVPGGIKELSLESHKWYMTYVKILITDQNPNELRSVMIQFLPEKQHESSFADFLARKMGL